MYGWIEIDDERRDIEGVDKRNDPFEHGGRIAFVETAANNENDKKGRLDDDKSQLNPKGSAKQTVMSVIWESYKSVVLTEARKEERPTNS